MFARALCLHQYGGSTRFNPRQRKHYMVMVCREGPMHILSIQRGAELLISPWGSREGMCRVEPPSPTIPPAHAPSHRAVANGFKPRVSRVHRGELER